MAAPLQNGLVMNNFKKIGLSALAGSLVAVSAHAADVAVSGGASVAITSASEGIMIEGLVHRPFPPVEVISNVIWGVEVSEDLLVIAKELFIGYISNLPLLNHQGIVWEFINASHREIAL